MIRSAQKMISWLMLESPYVRDSNMCSLFVVAIAVSSLAEKWLQRCLHDVVGDKFGVELGRLGRIGSSWDKSGRVETSRLESGQVGSSWDKSGRVGTIRFKV